MPSFYYQKFELLGNFLSLVHVSSENMQLCLKYLIPLLPTTYSQLMKDILYNENTQSIVKRNTQQQKPL